jgi:hypothetical protein
MPINLKTQESIIIDKVKIEISPDTKSITLHYSKDYIDSENNFVPRSLEKIDFNDVVMPENLYTSAKDFLYNLLDNSL